MDERDPQNLDRNALPESRDLRDFRGAGLRENELDRDRADGWTVPRGRQDRDLTERRAAWELREREAACIKKVEGLKPEAWRENSSRPERNLEAVNELERRLAELHGREAVPVRMIPDDLVESLERDGEPRLPDGLMREDLRTGTPIDIWIHPKHLKDKDPSIAEQVVLHEVQHVKQFQAIRSPESRPEIPASKREEIDRSRASESFAQDNGTTTLREYWNYAHERDARDEAARIYFKSL